jgi:hypothetical protein
MAAPYLGRRTASGRSPTARARRQRPRRKADDHHDDQDDAANDEHRVHFVGIVVHFIRRVGEMHVQGSVEALAHCPREAEASGLFVFLEDNAPFPTSNLELR